VVSALFVVFSGAIASLQGNKDVSIIYLAIAPSVFLVCIISAFRGYFQGLQNMVPTALSQIIEQLVKMAAGITLALILINKSVEMAVFGAILAVTVSEVVALGFLIITFLVTRKKDAQAETKTKIALDFGLMKSILKQSAPITFMASIFPLILVFDSLVVINLLKSAGVGHEEATKLFGIQSGAVHTLINLPAVLGVALSTAVVPTVTSLIKQDKPEELRTKCALAIKSIFIISVFFAGFYLAFGDSIIDLLYHGAFKDNPEHFKIARNLLRIESTMIVLMGLTSVFSAMLQASDRAKLPLVALAAGGVVKIVFEVIFITSPIGIYAVSISNVLCFAVAVSVNAFFALRTVKIKSKLIAVLLKFVVLILVLAASLFGLKMLLPSNRWFVIPAGVVTLFIYGISVIMLKLFDKNEQKVFNKLSVHNTPE
jgi:stage V sporulation protein B